MSVGFGAYDGWQTFKGFDGLVNLSIAMQGKLSGASVEQGYSISGPNEGGYYSISGPDLPNPIFTPGNIPVTHPTSGKLIFQPYIPKSIKGEVSQGLTVVGVLVVLGALWLLFGKATQKTDSQPLYFN